VKGTVTEMMQVSKKLSARSPNVFNPRNTHSREFDWEFRNASRHINTIKDSSATTRHRARRFAPKSKLRSQNTELDRKHNSPFRRLERQRQRGPGVAKATESSVQAKLKDRPSSSRLQCLVFASKSLPLQHDFWAE